MKRIAKLTLLEHYYVKDNINSLQATEKELCSNILFECDNLIGMKYLICNNFNDRAKLIYVDPPFDSNSRYFFAVNKKSKKSNLIKTDNLSVSALPAKKMAKNYYFRSLKIRFLLAKKILTPDGVFIVRIGSKNKVGVKVLLDQVFGTSNFLGEIKLNHNTPYITKHSKEIYDYLIVYSQDKVLLSRCSFLSSNEIDWTDIPGYSSTTGFSAENSEDLLQRIISKFTQKNDLVLDMYAGSGTTLVVAQKLDRRWIGFEIQPLLIAVIRNRILSLIVSVQRKKQTSRYLYYSVYGMPKKNSVA